MGHVTRNQETVAQNLPIIGRDKVLDAGHLFHERWQEITLRSLIGHGADFLLEKTEKR